MFVDPYFVSVLFRLVNFFVLIVVLTYLSKRYFGPFLREQILTKKQAIKDLKTQKDDFKQRQKEITKQTAEQEKLGALLVEKIDVWNGMFEKENEQIERARVAALEALTQRMKMKGRLIALSRMQRKITRTAFVEAEEILRQKFSTQKMGNEFIQGIVKQMESGAS